MSSPSDFADPRGMKRVLVSPSVVGAEVGFLFGAKSSFLSWTGDFGAPPIAATGRKAAERAHWSS